MKIKFNTKDYDDMVKELYDIGPDAMKELLPFYKSKTPKAGGFARKNTFQKRNKIESKYGYAGRLDDGWSDQAPKGFTERSIDKLDNIVDKIIRRVT